MKERLKKRSPFLLFLTAAALFLAALLLDERIPKQLSVALCTLGGTLTGFGAVAIALSGRHMTAQEKKELELGETDERNVAIREKAAMSSWYWTLYMLWAAFLVIQIFVGGLWGLAVAGVIVLHCIFYLVNLSRWNKRM